MDSTSLAGTPSRRLSSPSSASVTSSASRLSRPGASWRGVMLHLSVHHKPRRALRHVFSGFERRVRWVGHSCPTSFVRNRLLWKWRGLDFTVLIPPDQFDLLFGRIQDVLAMLNEKCPPLIAREALLQPHLALLDLGQDLLELFEGFFEVLGGGLGFFGSHWK